MSLDRYARMAHDHMRTYLPGRFSQIDDPEAYFTDLGAQVSDQVEEMWAAMTAQAPPEEGFLERAGRFNRSWMAAEEVVLADLVWLTPEVWDPEDPDVTVDESGAYTGGPPGWRSLAQEIWEADEEWRAQMVAQGCDEFSGLPIEPLTVEEEAMLAELRIPMNLDSRSDRKRTAVPIESGHLAAGG